MTAEPATVSEQSSTLDLEAIVRELDLGIDQLPVSTLRTCQTHREQVTPRLIQVLEETAQLGREGISRDGNAPFFAVFLLTEFRAKESLPAILELFSLRDPVLDHIVGGTITEVLPRTLAALADDNPDLIESLIPNAELDDFVRWAAPTALTYMVRDGQMSRSDAIERLTRQLRNAIDRNDPWSATIVVCELGNLNPLEDIDLIREAFEQRFVDESIIDWSCFDEFLIVPDQPGTCPQLESLKLPITDTVAELKGWWCFSEEAQESRRRSQSRRDTQRDQEARIEHEEVSLPPSFQAGAVDTIRHTEPRVRRNDPCPCGSGKKFKKCCLRQ